MGHLEKEMGGVERCGDSRRQRDGDQASRTISNKHAPDGRQRPLLHRSRPLQHALPEALPRV